MFTTVPFVEFIESKEEGENMQNEIIRSRQNPLIKLVVSLSQKKGREESGLFRFDGIKLCCEALSKGVELRYLLVCESKYQLVSERIGALTEKAGKSACGITVLSDELFSKISEEKSPEGVICVAKTLDKLHKIVTINNKGQFLPMPERSESVLLLEAIRDPGNLGTIIRSAASLGVDRIALSSDCADLYNPKTIRAAMGALFTESIDILPPDKMPDYISALRQSGRRVFAAALHREARRIGEFELLADDCFVIGNEGHGLTDAVISACEGCAIIPMREDCESLNAAMAAGIFIWEMSRAKSRK